MYHFWVPVIKPLFDILQPLEIVEIGADFGHNTRNILEYCRQTNSRAHIIDPLPKFEPDMLKSEYGNVFEFYKSLSLDALPLIPRMDAVLIDGDHNWYTVYHELKLIEKNCRSKDSVFPLIVVHDVAWPYARRDLYYNPENIPEEYRMPYAQKGLVPGSHEMIDNGGLNPHLNNAVFHPNARSGVLTAVEDFVQESDSSFRFIKIPGFHGLGILFPSEHETTFPLLSGFTRNLFVPDIILNIFEAVETSRIENMIAYKENCTNLKNLEKIKRRESDESKKEIIKLTKLLSIKEDQLKALSEKVVETAAEGEKNKNQLSELKSQCLQERNVFEIERQHYQKKLNMLRAQRDQLVRCVEKIRFKFNALLESNRWRAGHVIISMLTLSIFKKKVVMVTDQIQKQFQLFDQIRLSNEFPENGEGFSTGNENDESINDDRMPHDPAGITVIKKEV